MANDLTQKKAGLSLEASKKIRVALVEDHNEFRLHFEEIILESSECSLAWSVGTGKEALDQVKTCDFDVLLCDLNLPDMNGIAVVEAANALCPDSNIMIISLFGDEASVIESLGAGAKGYVLKNDLPNNLIRTIQDLTLGHSPISPQIARGLLRKFHLIEDSCDKKNPLTPKESLVLQLLAAGKSLKATAQELGNSVATINGYTKSIYRKLGVNSKMQAAYIARQKGWFK
jgi:DNA-binding NarL/FixJ family response regulator